MGARISGLLSSMLSSGLHINYICFLSFLWLILDFLPSFVLFMLVFIKCSHINYFLFYFESSMAHLFFIDRVVLSANHYMYCHVIVFCPSSLGEFIVNLFNLHLCSKDRRHLVATSIPELLQD